MTYEIAVKKCGSLVKTVVLNAPTAKIAMDTAERQLKVKHWQVMLGNRPVLWCGYTFQARQV